MGIGAAVAAGAATAAIGSVAGSALSSSAAKSAASTQAAAADEASQNSLAQFQQTEGNESPFLQAGYGGLAGLETALGVPNTTSVPSSNPLTANGISGLTFQPTQAQLAATPGYQFDLTQGLQATQNANAATGNGVSGEALKGAASYATGLANNTLTTQQGIFQQNLQNVLGPLTNLTNLGQNAGVQVGQQGVAATQNANSALIGGANAQAAGTVGSANALSSGLSALGGSPLNYALYSQLLNPAGGGGQNYVDNGSF